MGRRSRRCSLKSSPSRTPAIRPRTSRRPDPRSRWPSTAIPPTAPGASWTRSSRPTRRSCARSRRRTRLAAATRRTRLGSTWRRARSPAPPDRPPGCDRSRTGTSPTSAGVPGMPARGPVHHLTDGRSIHVGLYEQQLQRARARQTDPAWKADYTATRPKVERKISHLMRRRHGGRRARVRGHTKVDADFTLLAAAVNLARLATLGVTHHTSGWAVSTA